MGQQLASCGEFWKSYVCFEKKKMNNKNNNAIQESVQTLGEAIRTRVPELGDHDGRSGPIEHMEGSKIGITALLCGL